ncbi:MAG: hypothetical protein ACPGSC_00450 [Granulosicoccaceae bacterium]
MQARPFDSEHSTGILWRIGLLLLILAFAAAALREHVSELYFGQALTSTGLVINGAIVLLFLTGIVAIVLELLRLSKEEKAILRFYRNQQTDSTRPLAGIASTSLVAQRYTAAEMQYRKHLPVNHGALAQILVAHESSRLGFPRFINNILILTGVFGTIVSLSIALVGASDMLSPDSDMSGMNMVIHGMSTALSTTITAIVCFIIFGFAFYKTSDAQTRIIAAIESITIDYLLPRFHVGQDKINGELHELILSLREVVTHMQTAQHNARAVEKQIADGLTTHDQRMAGVVATMRTMEGLLQRGFRIDPNERN